MIEAHDTRLKRLKMRSMRRGIREMDLLLGSFADTELGAMSEDGLSLYEDMLSENDQDLYAWVTKQTPTPGRYEALFAAIRVHAARISS
jgi:antitoxin CptB